VDGITTPRYFRASLKEEENEARAQDAAKMHTELRGHTKIDLTWRKFKLLVQMIQL
jgi:hypothetical protein